MLSSLLLSAVLVAAAQCSPFQASLSLSSSYQQGEEVTCQVTLTNTLDTDLYLYTRYTPLRPSRADIFAVSLDGSRVPYDGFHFKMAPLRKDSEAVLMLAKESVSKMVDLSQVYSMSKPGRYQVKLDTEIFYRTETGRIVQQPLTSQAAFVDITPTSDTAPRQTVGEKLRIDFTRNTSKPSNTSTGTVKDPTFDGDGDDVDKKDATTAWEDAYTVFKNTTNVIDKAGGQFVKWFGERDEGRIDTVKGIFESIQKAMEDDSYTLYLKGQECTREDFSYQFFQGSYIYLCPKYFQAEDKFGYNSKMGTLIHALAVVVTNRVDFARIYEPLQCQDLAIDAPLRVIGSAYNYEYFCEDIVV